MVEKSDIADLIASIQSDVKAIVRGEIELAKAELIPQAKRAGIGAGLFGAVGYLGLSAMAVLFSTIGFAWAIGFQAWFHLDLLPALFWGFLTDTVTILLLAGVLALIGKAQLTFSEPKATITQAEASVTAVKDAVERGKDEVAEMPLTGRARPEVAELP
jgi:preprotein translocase subunit Sss1